MMRKFLILFCAFTVASVPWACSPISRMPSTAPRVQMGPVYTDGVDNVPSTAPRVQDISSGSKEDEERVEHDHSLLFYFYKKYISPADGSRCSMLPSCSSYAEQVFRRHGPLMGWIMTCDRLIRCGRDETGPGRSPKVRSEEGRILNVDPVEANDFWLRNGQKQF
ncbi:MAG: membrane protein insertion efficiency factor YidD [Desulfamplus sp.]|nr:membrane protein insertion efficiency factor YidD [Desulfamplus sp.]